MKKQFATIIMLSISMLAAAQIKVTPGGDFAIGQNYITNNLFKTEINGERKTALALSTRHEENYAWASISDATHPLTKHWIVSRNGYMNSHNFYVLTNGNAYAVNWLTLSDDSAKKNIQDIPNATQLLMALNPKYYTYKDSFLAHDGYDTLKSIGFIAQDLQTVLPQLVRQDDSSGLYRINYQGIIPLLVQHAKDQELRILELEQSLSQCCSTQLFQGSNINGSSGPESFRHNPKLEASKEFSSNSEISAANISIIPNPNQGTFEVSCTQNYDNLIITDLEGKMIKDISIMSMTDGKTKLSFRSNKSGVYYLHIVQNGNVLGSKKVVVLN